MGNTEPPRQHALPTPALSRTLELPVAGMDCAACARKARHTLMKVPGVRSADVLLNAEKAVIQFDAGVATADVLRATIERAGFSVPRPAPAAAETGSPARHVLEAKALQRQLFTTLGILFGAILFMVVIGEGLGLFDQLTDRVALVGLLIKGGKVIEALVGCDVMLVDKTGTLTTGRPRITDVVPLGPQDEATLLRLAATAERHSEHPLAEAVRTLAEEHGMPAAEPARFQALPGCGVRAVVD